MGLNFVAIDFETAASRHDTPCEIGLAIVENSEIVRTAGTLIKPHCWPDFNFHNIRVHGIKPEEVAESPTFDQFWGSVGKFMEGRLLLAHNAPFDMSVLRKTLTYYNLPKPQTSYVCSLAGAKKMLPGLPKYDLKTLCRRYGIDFNHHRAKDDAAAAAKMFLAMCQEAGVKNGPDYKALTGLSPKEL